MTALIEAQCLVRRYPVRSGWFGEKRWLRAVENVDLRIEAGESVALVGESGCGKSTTARLITQLEHSDSGTILLEGRNVTAAHGSTLSDYRRHVQLVFQDPLESLNPRQTPLQIVSRPLINFKRVSRGEVTRRVSDLLVMVGLSPASEFMRRYPHQMSGGQRQRVGIAAARAAEPSLLVADEPVASLDISVRAQILNLLQRLRQELKLSLLFISHDLGVVRSLCSTTAVMYLGEIVEVGPTEKVLGDPRHPYTRAADRGDAGRYAARTAWPIAHGHQWRDPVRIVAAERLRLPPALPKSGGHVRDPEAGESHSWRRAQRGVSFRRHRTLTRDAHGVIPPRLPYSGNR